jgi:WD40 repeat protein
MLRTWDVPTGRVIRQFAVGRIGSDRFQFVGRTSSILVSTWTHLELWDTDKAERIHVFEDHPDWIRGVAVDASGTMAATASRDGSIRVWNLEKREVMREWRAERHRIDSVSMSRDGRILATGENEICLWEVATGKLIDRVPGSGHFGLTPAGTHLVYQAWGEIGTCEIGSPAKKQLLDCGVQGLGPMAFSEAHCFVSRGSKGQVSSISRLEVNTLKIDKTYEESPLLTSMVAVTPDGRLMAAGGASETIAVWDVDSGKLLTDVGGHRDKVLAVKWDREGRTVHSVSQDHRLAKWNSRTGKLTRILEPVGGFWGSAISGDGVVAGEGDNKGALRLFNHDETRFLGRLDKALDHLTCIAWSPSGSRIACGTIDGVVKVWRVTSQEPLLSFASADGRSAQAVCFSHDEATIVAGFDSGIVQAVSIESGMALGSTHLGPKKEISSIACSPDGQLAVVGAAGLTGVIAIDADSWVRAREFPLDEAILSVTFARDGRMLLGGTRSGRIVGWEVATHVRVLDSKVHDGPVDSMDLSPDGRFIATGGRDTQVGIWSLKADVAPPSVSVTAINDLGAPDPRRAYRALWELAEGGKRSLELIGPLWRRAPDHEVDAVIQQLDADLIVDREVAAEKLRGLDIQAEPRIRERLKDKELSAGLRTQLTGALTALAAPPSKCPPAGLRRQRLFQAIEFMDRDVSEPYIRSLESHESETIQDMARAAQKRFLR